MTESAALPFRFSFSQSSLQSFLSCAYQFRLRYLDQLVWPAQLTRDQATFERDRQAGIRLHHLIHQYILGIDLSELVLSAKNDPDSRVWPWFEQFLAFPAKELEGRLFPEYSLTAVLNGWQLSARFDLIQVTPQALVIYDWKSSHRPPARAWLGDRVQTSLFPLVVSLSGSQVSGQAIPLPVRMSYWEASSPSQTIDFFFGEAEISAAGQWISGLIKTIAGLRPDQFLKTTDLARCRYCPYRTLCERDVASGNYQEEEPQHLLYDVDWVPAATAEDADV